MGSRLLLAIALIIVAHTVTFISPLPIEWAAKRPQPEAVPASPNSASPGFSPPMPELPPSVDPSIENDEPRFQVWQTEPPVNLDQPHVEDDRNPVWAWEQEHGDTMMQPYASARSVEGIADVCEQIKAAVVTVRAGREIGSGSIVRSHGLVITNHHVIRRLRDQSLSIELQNGMQYTGQVIASDRRYDLALIQLDTDTALPTVPLAKTTTPAIGQAVCAIGSPFGQAGVVTAGQLVSILPNGDLQSDVELQPGNSGGPLINLQGQMIGVNKGVARSRRGNSRATIATPNQRSFSSQHISYATSASVVDRLIQQSQKSGSGTLLN